MTEDEIIALRRGAEAPVRVAPTGAGKVAADLSAEESDAIRALPAE